jgi:uncharacterized small protein (DUF1192 family)
MAGISIGWCGVERKCLQSAASGKACHIKGTNMSNDNSLSLAELNDRIAILRDNVRQLVEQAAASSGAQDDERTSGRMAQQQAELDKLIAARDAISKK